MAPNDDAARRRDAEQTVNLHHPDREAASTDFELVPDGPASLGDYDLLEELGAGGMGRVWRARQRSQGRVVALKTLLPRYRAMPGLVQRFRKEAEAAGQLDHPGIVPVWGIDEAEGQIFFTMPLVHGRGLDERLRQGPLDNRRAALIVQRVAEAVGYAHRRNVIHRDLKPGNILVDREGAVKVSDFGLARRLDERDLDALEEAVRAAHPETVGTVMRLTRAGAIMGTPGYMAPEQATASGQAGPSADIWSLGAILYACLTGRPPFIGADVIETVTLTIESEVVPPSEINPEADPALVEFCMRCLRKDPAERFASAEDLAAELARWREGQIAPTVWEVWRGRAARFLAGSPELVPLVTGLIVHRLDTIQTGLFAGCTVAGIGWAARRGLPGLAILPLLLVLLFFFALPMGTLIGSDSPWLAGVPVGLVGLLGLCVTMGCGLAALDPSRPRYWSGYRIGLLCFATGLPALVLSIGAALAVGRLREIDAGGISAAVAVEYQIGRAAGWLLAVPLGLATGALLGRLNQRLDQFGREPLPAFALGASAWAVAAALLLRLLRPDSPTMAARFTAAGPGPALSIADALLGECLGGPEARQTAAAGAVYLKLLLLTAPMALGGALASWGDPPTGGQVMTTRFGDFELQQRAGRDGPFLLFRARQVSLGRLVLLKVLPERTRTLERTSLLRREAEAADRLDHSGVVRVYEHGDVAGTPYLAQAPIEGETLAERLRTGPVPPRLALDLTRQIAEAVAHAHDRHVLHGSLRPEAIWLTRDGHVRLACFGCPVLFEQLDEDAVADWAGFLAPEQAGAGVVGRATDIYGLGALLYAMATGVAPHRGATVAETCRLIRSRPAVRPSRLHPGLSLTLDEICTKCLRASPARRYGPERALTRLIADLRRAGGGRAEPAPDLTLWLRRHTRLVRAAVLLLVLGVVPALWDRQRHRSAWERLSLAQTSAEQYESAARHFERLAAERPFAPEAEAGLTLARFRTGGPLPRGPAWRDVADEWDAIRALSHVLSAAKQGNRAEARDALHAAHTVGYEPRGDTERRLIARVRSRRRRAVRKLFSREGSFATRARFALGS